MSSREIPVADIELIDQLTRQSWRHRADVIAGQLSFDWTIPPDTSLDVYRANVRALQATRPCRYGHTTGRYANGDCKECRRIADTAAYRLARGIPLDAPLMTRSDASKLGVAARRHCPHGPDVPRYADGWCKLCKRVARGTPEDAPFRPRFRPNPMQCSFGHDLPAEGARCPTCRARSDAAYRARKKVAA